MKRLLVFLLLLQVALHACASPSLLSSCFKTKAEQKGEELLKGGQHWKSANRAYNRLFEDKTLLEHDGVVRRLLIL